MNSMEDYKLALVSESYNGRSVFYEFFYLMDNVNIYKTYKEVPRIDCIICPCDNAFGIPTGVAGKISGCGFIQSLWV
jgi:hypothetical protein